MNIFRIVFLSAVFCPAILSSQNQIDSLVLKEAKVIAQLNGEVNSGSLEEILMKDGRITVKDSGPSGITSVSIRGGNSSQVSVSWNGIDINSPMLGQSDIALVSPSLFENVSYSSSIRSFTGITGGLNFNSNNTPAAQGHSFNFGFRKYSFSANQARGKYQFASKKHFLSISTFYDFGDQNYSYPLENGVKEISHGRLDRKGVLTSYEYHRNEKQSLKVFLWAQDSFNEIPPRSVQTLSRSSQEDKFLRAQVHLAHQSENWKFETKIAAAHVENNYSDSLNWIFSENKYQRLLTELSAERTKDTWYSQVKISSEIQQAETPSYFNKIQRKLTSGQLHIRKSLGSKIINLKGLSTLIDGQFSNGLLSYLDVQISEKVLVSLGYSSLFRIPSLNDLFWNPGGNQFLETETARGGELAVKLDLNSKHKFAVRPEIAFYSRLTKNWILWSFDPEIGFWSPTNINEVNSYGLEFKAPLKFELAKSSLSANLGFQFTSSTFLKQNDLPNIEVGEQVYYVPRIGAQAEVNYSIKSWTLNANVLHRGEQNGVQFILPEFTLVNAALTMGIKTRPFNFSIGVRAKNIFNTRYEMVEFRPLPGRHFLIEINIKSHKNESKN